MEAVAEATAGVSVMETMMTGKIQTIIMTTIPVKMTLHIKRQATIKRNDYRTPRLKALMVVQLALVNHQRRRICG